MRTALSIDPWSLDRPWPQISGALWTRPRQPEAANAARPLGLDSVATLASVVRPRHGRLRSSIAILGCGTMGEAIVAGLVHANPDAATRIIATSRRAARRDDLAARLKVRVSDDNVSAAAQADVILLCLKPRGVLQLLEHEDFCAQVTGKVLVSIAAGVSLGQLARCPERRACAPCRTRRAPPAEE